MIQKDLANTLKIIRDEKRKGLHDGEITKKIIESLGSESLLSLKKILGLTNRFGEKPIISKINEYKIISMLSSIQRGIALSQLIKMLFNFETNNLNIIVLNTSIYYLKLKN